MRLLRFKHAIWEGLSLGFYWEGWGIDKVFVVGGGWWGDMQILQWVMGRDVNWDFGCGGLNILDYCWVLVGWNDRGRLLEGLYKDWDY